MASTPCGFCTYEVPLERTTCPHCARPALYPNVRAAELAVERQALADRYRAALQDSDTRGCRPVVEAFEVETGKSKAVIARSLEEADRLASSDQQLYSTYYRQIEAELRLPDGSKWDKLRRLADAALFSEGARDVRFAALALDGSGLPGYGECSLVLREDMIGHRASVFEENSAIFMKKNHYEAPAGHRATWSDRGKHCVAKLAQEIDSATPPARFPEILLRPGASPEEDHFVEVHVWGPLSRRAFERVVLVPGTRRPRRSVVKALRDRLGKVGVPLEER
jgi:hypothetical protein